MPRRDALMTDQLILMTDQGERAVDLAKEFKVDPKIIYKTKRKRYRVTFILFF
jgi:hypothetical protein